MVTRSELQALDVAIEAAKLAEGEARRRLDEVAPEYLNRQAAWHRAVSAVDRARRARAEASRAPALHPQTVRGILIKAGLRQVTSFNPRFTVEQSATPDKCLVSFWRSSGTADEDVVRAREALAAAGLVVEDSRHRHLVPVRRPRPVIEENA